MERFKNLLVAMTPGHFDASALRSVGTLLKDNGAKVTLMDVLEPLPAWRRVVTLGGRTLDVEDLMARERTTQLQDRANLLQDDRAVVVVKTGKPFIEIIRHAVTHECDLVVVGEPAAEAATTSGISSGVIQLLRKCPVPVWVARPTRARKLRILALVDPDSSDPVREGLNDLVVDLATSIARRRGGELHVAHAWEMIGEDTLRSSSFVSVPDIEVDLMVAAEADERRSQLDKLAGKHGVVEMGGRTHLVHGAPTVVLPDLARKLNTNLIVMGTVARTGLSGFIMGNTAETVLRSVDCSVLAVKPAGFVSPVKLEGHGPA